MVANRVGGVGDFEVAVPVAGATLHGRLTVPDRAAGVVLFAHGTGSGRHSPRNRFVAEVLNRAGLGTLLFDLLDPVEESGPAADVGLLAGRLSSVTRWLRTRPAGRSARLGYFGASTGAGAALWAAAGPDPAVAAVVSRGGRPDLAGERLGSVRVPTLLLVGGADERVLELNRWALRMLAGPARLAVVPGATHLFTEPGTLPAVAELARDWFVHHLADGGPDRAGPR